MTLKGFIKAIYVSKTMRRGKTVMIKTQNMEFLSINLCVQELLLYNQSQSIKYLQTKEQTFSKYLYQSIHPETGSPLLNINIL
jgi:hypothetical protein